MKLQPLLPRLSRQAQPGLRCGLLLRTAVAAAAAAAAGQGVAGTTAAAAQSESLAGCPLQQQHQPPHLLLLRCWEVGSTLLRCCWLADQDH
jgi:hypothetical protein